jgi:hypothetical protein
MSNGHRHHCKRREQWKPDHCAQCGADYFEPKRSWRHTPSQSDQDKEPSRSGKRGACDSQKQRGKAGHSEPRRRQRTGEQTHAKEAE